MNKYGNKMEQQHTQQCLDRKNQILASHGAAVVHTGTHQVYSGTHSTDEDGRLGVWRAELPVLKLVAQLDGSTYQLMAQLHTKLVVKSTRWQLTILRSRTHANLTAPNGGNNGRCFSNLQKKVSHRQKQSFQEWIQKTSKYIKYQSSINQVSIKYQVSRWDCNYTG